MNARQSQLESASTIDFIYSAVNIVSLCVLFPLESPSALPFQTDVSRVNKDTLAGRSVGRVESVRVLDDFNFPATRKA